MEALRGVLGLILLLAIAFLASRDRRGIRWRTVVVALVIQVIFAFLVLRTGPGKSVLNWLSKRVETLIGFTQSGTDFVFGPLAKVGAPSVAFALQVLPVIIFLGALIYLLLYLRVIQYATHFIGGAIGKLLRVSKVESMYAAVVVFLGMSEAPLLISPYLKRLTASQTFTVVVAGLTAASGSTLIGYALLGAPLPYLLAATVMNAPAALVMAKIIWPDTVQEPVESVAEQALGDDASVPPKSKKRPAKTSASGSASSSVTSNAASQQKVTGRAGRRVETTRSTKSTTAQDDFDVRDVRDTDSANVIDALARGALAGGRVAVTIGCLLIAFVALIALANGIIGGIAGLFGAEQVTFQRLLGYVMAPVAWLLGVPWSEAVHAGQFIGVKTVLNEFVAFGEFGPQVASLSPVTVVVVTFALAGFANFGSIAIAIGALGSLRAQIRGFVARVGLRALLAATLANLANAAIAGLVFAR